MATKIFANKLLTIKAQGAIFGWVSDSQKLLEKF